MYFEPPTSYFVKRIEETTASTNFGIIDYFFGFFLVIYRIIPLNYLLLKEVYFLFRTRGGRNCWINGLQNKLLVFSCFVSYKKQIIMLFVEKKQTYNTRLISVVRYFM